jgi:two-component system, OmpR family, sensor histidine kinase BaeS
MTSDRRPPLGPLGRRLIAAFVLVALASIAVLTVAALIGTVRGLDAGQGQQRQDAADATARAAADAYAAADGWASADLTSAVAIAGTTGAEVTVRDNQGSVVMTTSSGMGPGAMNGTGRGGVSADVVVGGQLVGSVRLGFGTPAASSGRAIAWTWILAAAVAALVVAFVVALFTSRWLTSPIVRLSAVARAFARGDRAVRPAPQDMTASTELGDLARAFDAAADDVSRSEAARRRLSADVAHELRTPLAALQAGLEELEDGLVPPTPERLAALHHQAARLGRIVEDLAVLSAAESAVLSLRREPVDLAALVDDAVSAARPSCTARGIAISLEDFANAHVTGDVDRLHQAVGNLLSNAARYCRPGDEVRVSVSTSARDATVTVRDTGPGIPPEDLPHVFDRLWRGATPASGAGTGIGLAVVRELTEAHGGTVAVASDGQSGTTFTITLPLATAPN